KTASRYWASGLPPAASFCSSVAAAAKFLSRIEVLTPSSGSGGRETASAAPAASTIESAAGSSARTRLGRAMFRFDGYTYALEEFGGQHTSGAHRSEEHTSELQSPCNLV